MSSKLSRFPRWSVHSAWTELFFILFLKAGVVVTQNSPKTLEQINSVFFGGKPAFYGGAAQGHLRCFSVWDWFQPEAVKGGSVEPGEKYSTVVPQREKNSLLHMVPDTTVENYTTKLNGAPPTVEWSFFFMLKKNWMISLLFSHLKWSPNVQRLCSSLFLNNIFWKNIIFSQLIPNTPIQSNMN